MNNEQYWQERLETRISDSKARADKLGDNIAGIYKQQIQAINKDIHNYLYKYQLEEVKKLDVDNNALAYFNQHMLDATDLADYRQRCDTLIEKYNALPDGEIKDRVILELRLLRSKQQVTIWQGIKGAIVTDMIQAGVEFDDEMAELLAGEYEEALTFAHYEQAVTTGVPYVLSKPNVEAVKELLAVSFNHADFSQTIWQSNQSAINLVEEKVKSVLIRGKGVKQMARELQNELKGVVDVTRYQSQRIIQTESARAFNTGRTEALKQRGHTTYKVLAVGDEKTCDKCGKLDGKEFPMDKQVLPAHPNCRCSVLTNMDDGSRYTRDEKYYLYEGVLYNQEQYDKIKKNIPNKSLVKVQYPEDLKGLSYKKFKEKYVK